jgi:hypothetical protein
MPTFWRQLWNIEKDVIFKFRSPSLIVILMFYCEKCTTVTKNTKNFIYFWIATAEIERSN